MPHSAEAPLQRAYRQSIARHGYRSDPAQEQALVRLEDLRLRLESATRSDRGFIGRRLDPVEFGALLAGSAEVVVEDIHELP